jgi:plastocyanin
MRKRRNPAWWKIGGVPVALLTLALILAGCGASTGQGASGNPTATATATAADTATPQMNQPAVSIVGSGGYGQYGGSFSFSPSAITVKVGTTVVWTNTSGTTHTVTSDAGAPAAFHSGMINGSNGTYRFTFTKPGTYTYHCNIHPYMQGAVVVTP